MLFDGRRLAIALAGFISFTNLYAPQSVLPLLAAEFSAGAAAVSQAMTAATVAIVGVAPFSGALAERIGRRRLIGGAMMLLAAPTFLIGLAPDLATLIALRFCQGLLLPPIFAVAIAYIGQEWPPGEATAATGLYMAAASFGGFFGRFITGLLADWTGWRGAFFAEGALTLACALAFLRLLPRESRASAAPRFGSALSAMAGHLRDPQLLATYGVGFGVLFNFIAAFTYVSFHLAAPPFSLSPALIGSLFVIYLLGSAATPFTGRAVARLGRKPLVLLLIGGWALGIALTLAASLAAIVLGLALCVVCGFVLQTCSTSYIAIRARSATAAAVGLYVTSYYIGGSLGALIPGAAWSLGQWPAVAFTVLIMLAVMTLLVACVWPREA